MPRILCTRRKKETCMKATDVCVWDDTSNKCHFIETLNKTQHQKPLTSITTNAKTIRCGSRKEKGCKEVPQNCTWNITTQKCTQKQQANTPKKQSPKTKALALNIKASTMGLGNLLGMNNRHCYYYSLDDTKTIPFQKIVNVFSPYREPYDPKYKSQTNIHLGQRKLLLSEVQLLTDWYSKQSDIQKKHPTMLYVGAAPGTHLLFLHELFPQVHFVLYDGAKYDPKLKHLPNVFELHEGDDGFMTTHKCKELVKRFKNTPLLFVSDIRLTESKFEDGVARDMMLQKEWVELLKPELSLLKFRLPYNMKSGDVFPYFKGIIYYGIWPKQQSGETRLLVRRSDIDKQSKYKFENYEQNLFFHNKYSRAYCFPEKVYEKFNKYIISPQNQYCACYDCIAELTTIDNYSTSMKRNLDDIVQAFSQRQNTHFNKVIFKPKISLQTLPPFP